MSFKKFSESHVDSSKDKPDEKKATSTDHDTASQPAKKQDKASPAHKP